METGREVAISYTISKDVARGSMGRIGDEFRDGIQSVFPDS
jgi:hypothetical protein